MEIANITRPSFNDCDTCMKQTVVNITRALRTRQCKDWAALKRLRKNEEWRDELRMKMKKVDNSF